MGRCPLKFLTPDNHGDAAWVFVANFGGGLVDGDHLATDVDVGPQALALLGTQAQTKVYRSPNGCAQTFRAKVAEGGGLICIPDLVSCFRGARYTQTSTVDLCKGASLVWLDGLSCGRSGHGERWQFGSYETRTTIRQDEKPIVIDATLLCKAHGPIDERMGRFDALSTLLVYGPRFASVTTDILAQGEGEIRKPSGARGSRPDLLVATSPLSGSGIIVRVAGTSVELVVSAMQQRLSGLTKILGDSPFLRKW